MTIFNRGFPVQPFRSINRSGAASSVQQGLPVLVQYAVGTATTGTTCTATFGSGTGGNPSLNGVNGVIIAVFNFNSSVATGPTGITVGGVAATQLESASPSAGAGVVALWGLPAVANGATSVVATWPSQDFAGDYVFNIAAFEFNNLPSSFTIDQTSNGAVEAAAWSSGETAALTGSPEIAFGVYGGWDNATFGPVVPNQDWTSIPNQTATASSAGIDTVFTAGFRHVVNEATVAFAGGGGNASFWDQALVATISLAGLGSTVSYSGAPNAVVNFTATATGAKRITENVNASVTFNATAAGVHKGNTGGVGASTGTPTLTLTCVGAKRIAEAVNFGPVTFTATAAGVHKGNTGSVGTSTTATFTAIATGKKSLTESVNFGPVTFTLTAAGTSHRTASVTTVVNFTETATGTSHRTASVSKTVTFTFAATGAKRLAESVSFGPVTLTFAATGKKSVSASATAKITFSETATATSSRSGSASLNVNFIATCIGVQVIANPPPATTLRMQPFVANPYYGYPAISRLSRVIPNAFIGSPVDAGAATASINFAATATGSKTASNSNITPYYAGSNGTTTASTSLVTTLSTTVSQGDYIFLFVGTGGAGCLISSITDTANLNWQFGNLSNVSRPISYAWAKATSTLASGVEQVTVNVSPSNNIGVVAIGIPANGSDLILDQVAGNGTTIAVPTISVTSGAPLVANAELFLGGLCIPNAGGTPSFSWAEIFEEHAVSQFSVSACYQNVTVETAQTFSANFSSTGADIGLVSFFYALPVNLSATATGSKHLTESASLGPVTFSLTVTSAKRIAEAVSLNATFTLTATGIHKGNTGAVAGTAKVTFAGSATGIHKGNTGAVAGTATATFTATCVGAKKLVESASLGPVHFTLTCAGAKRITKPVTFGPVTFTASAVGIHHGSAGASASATFTLTCAGAKRITKSVTAGPVTLTATATGIHHGNTGAVAGTATVTFTGTAAGIHHGNTGSVGASTSATFTATCVGAKRITKSVSFGPVTLTLSSAGAKRIAESVSFGPVTFAIAAIGYKSIAESDSRTVTFALSATGTKHGTGSASATVTFTGSAVGVHHGNTGSVGASAIVDYALVETAGGKRIAESVTLGPVTFTLTSTGGVGALAPPQYSMPGVAITGYYIVALAGLNRKGAASASPVKFTATAVGAKRITESASFGPVTLALSAVGAKRVTESKSFGPVTFALTATGAKRITESITAGPVTFALSATGAKRITKAVSAAVSFSASATGIVVITASLSTPLTRPFVPSARYGYPTLTQWSRILVPPASVPGPASNTGSPTAIINFAFTAAGKKTSTASVSASVNLIATATGHSHRSGSVHLGPVVFNVTYARTAPLDLGGTGDYVNPYGGTVTNAGDDNTLGGTITNDLFGGTVSVTSFDVLSGGTCILTSFDENSGGTIEDTNEYGGSEINDPWGGTATVSDPYAGTIVDNNNYGYENLVGWQMEAVNITLGEFNDESLTVTITSNGSPFNLTSYNVQMLLKTGAGVSDDDPSTIILSTLTSGVTITNASAGDVSVSIPNADLQSLGIGFYRIDVINSESLQNTAIYGSVTIRAL